MASKGPKSKFDHEPRTKRQKALEPPKEPGRPKTHWDHVLEEMVWLSKDFESERKWKLALAKKVAIRASKGMLDQATRGERRVKEEEHRLRKVALNISKDVKKFWIKIEKLVVYKHQLEVGEKKKKAQNKQLEFLLGQTERYSTMLAENLVASPILSGPGHSYLNHEHLSIQCEQRRHSDAKQNYVSNIESKSDLADNDEDYDESSEGQLEDDEHTIEEDEALITLEERQEELAALHSEIDLPLEELLKRYGVEKESSGNSPEKALGAAISTRARGGDSKSKEIDITAEYSTERGSSNAVLVRRCDESNGKLSISENHSVKVDALKIRNSSATVQKLEKNHTTYDFSDEQEDGDFVLANGDEKDDETTLSEEECIANTESNNATDEIALLQKENEIPIEELLARYKKIRSTDDEMEDASGSEYASSENFSDASAEQTTTVELHRVPVEVNDEPNEHNPAVSPVSREQEAQPDQNCDEAGENESRIADAAAAARSAQPTGNTFLTTKVRTKHPFLLKFSLREYQHIGLDWLVTMYEKRLNGILADEMGLGKTIMTIALLAHLACEKGIWGPHLIVVPTSVMLNWETEFLKWCPAFKILTYFGCAKERKIKRQGWLKPNSFHVCITTYRLVIQDSKVFKRKKWKYLILDEAHLIKNWKSQRWQTLLNFNTKRRILLTGTPLQNDLMELWSLMHFLMPHIFQSHQEFKDWFSNPISGMVDGQEKVNKEVVDRLHNVLRPFILRRLKRDVEKQLPMKHEHVIYCRLSRRQRNLYEDYIASSETQATLASSNFFGMISVIMQLRKVCNHPDLFEGRPIVSSFDMNAIDTQLSSSVCSIFTPNPFSEVDLSGLGLLFTHLDFYMNSWESDEVQAIATPSSLIKGRASLGNVEEITFGSKHMKRPHGVNIFEEIQQALLEERIKEAKERAKAISWWNSLRCRKKPIYSMNLRELLTIRNPLYGIDRTEGTCSYLNSSVLANIILSPVERFHKMVEQVESFMFAIPAARAPAPICWCSRTGSSLFLQPGYKERCAELLSPLLTPIRPAIVRSQVYFPDRRLIQFDCGKLQELSILLRRLKSEGHRALIFTQMTKMLDVLEAFISLYGYTYMRLDGSTQPEERQTLMQRFNTNPKYFLFILSTRSGGVGVNLVGADTVIFYDSDWNPAMDQQAQDRCHRIGQTREVHIYRLISESTIEENILKKANQKRALDDLVIQSGSYNTDFFKKLDPMDLFTGHRTIPSKHMQIDDPNDEKIQVSLSNADVDAALKNAEDEADYMALKKVEQEEAVENQEFTEEAVGRLEDDEIGNEEEGHVSAVITGLASTSNRENREMIAASDLIGEGAVTLAGQDDDVDMLADVKQMAAAAAAAGQEILSFESQLRPIDRYAVRFLELWDPIIDKAAVESQVRFEETEWELDRIEKLKEDMEAEIDDDEEPFVYEQWDAEFATEVYKQQVEALAKHQLMEELELEAKEKERADHEYSDSMQNDNLVTPKPKSKKKKKKTKFKSLKKGALASESRAVKEESPIEFVSEPISVDDDYDDPEFITSSDRIPAPTSVDKKRKAAPSSNNSKKAKKAKKTPSEISPSALDFNLFSKQQDEPKDASLDLDHKPISRTKMGGKISITSMPVKRILTIRPEKMKKKGSMWSKDCFPSPDSWMPAEDAVLCATVHEYGPHWSMVSEILYGITAGGYYRGIFRHPVHCCERFRELFQRYILSSTEIQNDKLNNAGSSGKALLKVTEDNVRLLLGAVSELPDNEPLIQKHFFALLSSVWRASSGCYKKPRNSNFQANLYPGVRLLTSMGNHISKTNATGTSLKMNFANLSTTKKIVASALHDADATSHNDGVAVLSPRGEHSSVADQMVISLELPNGGNSDPVLLPSVVNVSICGPEPSPSTCTDAGGNKIRSLVAENRFRTTSGSRGEDCMAPTSSFSTLVDVELRMPLKSQSLGKHKLPISESVKSAKSKVRKTITESSDAHCAVGDPVFRKTMVATRDTDSRFDVIGGSSCPVAGTANYETTTDESSSTFDIEEYLTLDLASSNMTLDYYDPGLTSGLEDYSAFTDLTDIG